MYMTDMDYITNSDLEFLNKNGLVIAYDIEWDIDKEDEDGNRMEAYMFALPEVIVYPFSDFDLERHDIDAFRENVVDQLFDDFGFCVVNCMISVNAPRQEDL